MKNFLYALVAVAALAALVVSRNSPGTPRAVAAEAAAAVPGAITGDLVIDFLGSVRGYVEPCG